jgi:hypothetical protein
MPTIIRKHSAAGTPSAVAVTWGAFPLQILTLFKFPLFLLHKEFFSIAEL